MANIAITTYCNLKCPYCFADDMINTSHNNITIEQYKRILSFIDNQDSPQKRIGIIGGEPLLHPQIKDILNITREYCINNMTHALLFTNGILLGKYLNDLECINILININSPDIMTDDQWSKINAALNVAKHMNYFNNKITLGCNIHMNQTDYSYIWKMLLTLNVNRLRISVVSPGGVYQSWKSNKDEYFTKIKPIFMKFCEDAYKYHITLMLDCSFIPICYFTDDEKDLINKVVKNIRSGICHPVIDITPDFKATACFGAYDPVDCSQFNNIQDLERYLLHKKNYPRVQANCTGKCVGCKQHELLICQGGCLGFAQV